jgi:hypothetical protein
VSELITNETYADEMGKVMIAVQILDIMCRIDELLDIVVKSETLAPILEPTAYIRGGRERLEEQRRVLSACAEVVRLVRQIQPEVT